MGKSKAKVDDNGQPTQQSDEGTKTNQGVANKSKKAVKTDNQSKKGEVLISLPGGFKYQLPGKRQRIILGSLVIGLNIILVLAVIAYYYVPGFDTFVYNFGR